ncbi:MAG: hypothetical protein JO159_08775 [Acidobacteria bacterium]|nr:hypothetical protein [Acidobacteriota bacterium]
MRKSMLLVAVLLLPLLFITQSQAQSRPSVAASGCEEFFSLCTEREYNRSYDPEYRGHYIGHDEPSLLFYSNVPGSGNYNQYRLVLPKDPPKFPTDAHPSGAGSPTVWNFQLHPAFWFGMALCDTQSYPLATFDCPADSDRNIFDDANPSSPHYIGRHPGAAFLELQFYPPGWVSSYSLTQYAVALHINSYSLKPLGPNGPLVNNVDCQNKVGLETTVFALLTLDGKSQAPADPLNNNPNKFAVIPGETFVMNPGDSLVVTIRDTPDGLRTTVQDLTTGQTGFMTASIANGFAQIKFDPGAPTCTSIPYAYHPMYATASPHTRVPWAAHTYNIAFSDEIGHFNYCDAQDNSLAPGLGACLVSPVEDEVNPTTGTHEPDDLFCVDPASSEFFSPGSVQPFGGCLDADVDFDGVPYHHAWPGSGDDPYHFSAVPTPILFSSGKFLATGGGFENFSQVAFEADIPAIEGSTCNRATGAGCVNPPPGALFYPFYTTTERNGQCWWQVGGAHIPDTTNTFGGSSATEFKSLEPTLYIAGTSKNPGSRIRFENYNQILNDNPCPSQ